MEGVSRTGNWTLTPINETIVILGVCLSTVAFPLKNYRSNSFGPAGGVVSEGNFAERTDHSLEEFLKGART
jgi:hypothetical protein